MVELHSGSKKGVEQKSSKKVNLNVCRTLTSLSA